MSSMFEKQPPKSVYYWHQTTYGVAYADDDGKIIANVIIKADGTYKVEIIDDGDFEDSYISQKHAEKAIEKYFKDNK